MGVDLIFLKLSLGETTKRKLQNTIEFPMWYFTVTIVVFVTISMSGYVITIGTVVMLLLVL